MNDLPLPGIGHNQPPESIDLAKEDAEVAALIKVANAWAEKYPVIETESVAIELVNYLDQLDAYWNKFDSARKAEKKKHDDAIKEIQSKWCPRQEYIDICRRVLRPIRDAWIKLTRARDKADREAKEHEAAAAQRRADQLAEQAAAGGAGAVTNLIAAREASIEAENARLAAAAIPKRAQIRGSLTGRAHSLRTVWFAHVVKQDLCYQHFRDHADVKDVLLRLANAAARSGVRNPNLPGCYVESKEQ
jgi:hypothetical protein